MSPFERSSTTDELICLAVSGSRTVKEVNRFRNRKTQRIEEEDERNRLTLGGAPVDTDGTGLF